MTAQTTQKRVLVSNREGDVLRSIQADLVSAGFEVLSADDGPDLLAKAREKAPALVVLDTAMPGMTASALLRSLKSDGETIRTPVIMVTKCLDEADRVRAFELGAEDYIVSPFSSREFVLRVKAILSRCGARQLVSRSLKRGAIEVDSESIVVKVNGRLIDVTAVEYRLLVMLIRAAPSVVSRESLLKMIWGTGGNNVVSRTVDTHLSRLRGKLGGAAAQIQCVRGFGYRLHE